MVEPALIEKITKLVFEKLEGFEEKKEHSALTQEEIRRWNEISSTFQQPITQNVYLKETSVPLPLTSEEIKRWQQLTFSKRKEPDKDSERVKFYRHNRSNA